MLFGENLRKIKHAFSVGQTRGELKILETSHVCLKKSNNLCLPVKKLKRKRGSHNYLL